VPPWVSVDQRARVMRGVRHRQPGRRDRANGQQRRAGVGRVESPITSSA